MRVLDPMAANIDARAAVEGMPACKGAGAGLLVGGAVGLVAGFGAGRACGRGARATSLDRLPPRVMVRTRLVIAVPPFWGVTITL